MLFYYNSHSPNANGKDRSDNDDGDTEKEKQQLKIELTWKTIKENLFSIFFLFPLSRKEDANYYQKS